MRNYVFHQVAIRGNVVRQVDNALDVPDYLGGFGCLHCGAVLIDTNVFAIKQARPIQFHWCELVSCVNNLTREGTSVPAYDKVTNRSGDLYFPEAEDALLLAF